MMKISIDELAPVLVKFNPWWKNEPISLPGGGWRRAAFNELFQWVYNPPAPRAVLLSGARQVGKTTLLLQVIEELLRQKVLPSNILYVTFDHPLIKLAGIENVLEAWRLREVQAEGPEYLFLDEAQFIPNGETWVKHQRDFNSNRRIAFTGSAMPLIDKWQESGVGRWHTIKLSTLSFYEYLQLNFKFENPELFINAHEIKQEGLNLKYYNPSLELPKLTSFRELFTWNKHQFQDVSEKAISIVPYFHEYLMKGGFPQSVQINDINQAQRLLREDIIDKVLKRDMTALYNVRHVVELEHIFLYLCMHDGGLLDINSLCNNLEIKRPTAEKYINLLQATHLIYKLQPFGYGKDILRAKHKIYLADPAMASAVLLKGKSLLDDPRELGIATEAAVFKHIYSILSQIMSLSYWKEANKKEVDIIAQGEKIVPFEIKYREQHTGKKAISGLYDFCTQKSLELGYVITKSLNDFGFEELPEARTKILRIPAPLFCYWIGESEHRASPDVELFI